jgi:aspartate/methionine/tyrosine aminotransferase
MTFSRRSHVSLSLEENALTRATDRTKPGFLDLTISNPTHAALPYDADAIRAAFAAPEMLTYEPHPLGLESARRFIDPDRPDRVALTASTSEAYAVLFKLLCDPGDEVLVPTPSYPLLDWLASFEGVTLKTYPLMRIGGWHMDLAALAAAITPRTRAIVVVTPNNPTGSYLAKHELEALLDHDLPIISDEVFASYPFATPEATPEAAPEVTTVADAARSLTFALSGLSKQCALPQMKLGWMRVGGSPERVSEAVARLELVLDAYLSVGAPVQHALPALLRAGAVTADAIRQRTRKNLEKAAEIARSNPLITQLEVQGGWYVTWRVPETMSDEEWALMLVREDAVLVQPGYFFDMQRGAYLVLSLLTPEPAFEEGLRRIAARIRE